LRDGPAVNDVIDEDGDVVVRGDDDVANLANPAFLLGSKVRGRRRGGLHGEGALHRIAAAADHAEAAHHLHDTSLAEIVAANIRVAVGDGVLDLGERDAETLEQVRVGLDLVAFDGAADTAGVENARHTLELALQQPVLQRLQIIESVNVVAQGILGAAQRVTINLPRRALRRNLGLNAWRQILHELETIDNLLPSLLEVNAIVELVAQMREAKERLGARDVQAGHACQRHLQGDGDLAFHLLGAGSWEL